MSADARDRRIGAVLHAEQMLRLVDRGAEPNPLEAKAFQLMLLADIAGSLATIAEKLDEGPIWIRSGDVI